MKKETLIIVFYVLYFTWLFTITYLNPNVRLTNAFTIFVALFYFIFLREEWDFPIFFVAAFVPIIQTALGLYDWKIEYNLNSLSYMPFWLPVAWGTTLVALRKLFINLSDKV